MLYTEEIASENWLKYIFIISNLLYIILLFTRYWILYIDYYE